MTKEFKENVYDASYKALTESGVDEDVADKASRVVASDDESKSDLGRTPEDQEAVNQAMQSYWGNQRGEK